MSSWVRCCQECGHVQRAKEPDSGKELSASYANAKCKRCKSEALDYGKHARDQNNEALKKELSDE